MIEGANDYFNRTALFLTEGVELTAGSELPEGTELSKEAVNYGFEGF